MSAFPFPYAEVEVDKIGAVVDQQQVAAAYALVDQGASDLLVISHGWNNDMSEARALYSELAGSLATVLSTNAPAHWDDRRLGVVGILWPSMKYADADEVAGGAAALGDDADTDGLESQLHALAAFVDTPAAAHALDRARARVGALASTVAARAEFVDLVREAMRSTPPGEDTGLDAATVFLSDHESPEDLMQRLAAPLFLAGTAAPASGSGGAADLDPVGPTSPASGGAADLGGLGNALRAARNLLNYATYYHMKARAGTVGEVGVAEVLVGLRAHAPGVRLHLAGHSFGARVVSMAALKADPAPEISSVSLLQAAFSHYAFATDWEPHTDGFFRAVFAGGRLDGPMMVTHTVNDRAVGVAYAIASRLAGQQAQSVGGPDDIYGGLGRNGALSTQDTLDQQLLGADGTYDLAAGRVHNLQADRFIHSHGDVRGPEVALAILAAIATSS